ncbi:palmitoyltransferase PFA5 [Zalerion maritima]|uniref:Palmitoyltransferase n=1 Tax=Zalerion maritima TaxID=339359 RepID=A0AAD5WS07_9PEZI|nr:palmitoyltransferase PFA5 [Zalerion maritima]
MLAVLATYLRLFLVVTFDAGLVPLGEEAIQRRNAARRESQGRRPKPPDLESNRYNVGRDGPLSRPPGLETFYSKDVFVCESDGRPRWCSDCVGFKPDRAHHSSEMDRCVYKMDHFCPWVGGMVAENSFKFFFQFNVYTSLYCAVVLGSAAYGLQTQLSSPDATMDPAIVVSIALSGFFGLFTFMMSMTTLRYIFQNLSTVDALNVRAKVYQLAVRVDRDIDTDNKFGTVTYPLDAGQPTRPAPVGGQIAVAGDEQAQVSRDSMATRTFAILRTEAGENPWDLGWKDNWLSIMGSSIFDWVFPVRRSPCTNHESTEGFYPTGRVVGDLRRRYGIKAATNERDEIELRNMRLGNGQAE